jgi:hypothetical protein
LSIADNDEEIEKANNRLVSLARALDQEIEKLMIDHGPA